MHLHMLLYVLFTGFTHDERFALKHFQITVKKHSQRDILHLFCLHNSSKPKDIRKPGKLPPVTFLCQLCLKWVQMAFFSAGSQSRSVYKDLLFTFSETCATYSRKTVDPV